MREQKFTRPVGELKDRVIFVNRVTKVVAGGKRLRFTALVVVGDENGHVGFGKGKAREVPMAIQKAIKRARKNLIEVPIVGTTIPHEVIGRHDAGQVLLKPASRGTGVIAGGPVRAVLELAGIRDVLTKSMRSNNPFAVIRATFEALSQLESPESVAARRGKPLASFYRAPFTEGEEEAVPVAAEPATEGEGGAAETVEVIQAEEASDAAVETEVTEGAPAEAEPVEDEATGVEEGAESEDVESAEAEEAAPSEPEAAEEESEATPDTNEEEEKDS